MNKREIKRELRRSAEHDLRPWLYCGNDAFGVATGFVDDDEWLAGMPNDDLRTFYLLVAEAL